MPGVSKVVELFGNIANSTAEVDWKDVLKQQQCPYLKKRCIKVRKSEPEISIGTCTVSYGKENAPIVICPHRLMDKRQIFRDSLHLLTGHQPGNEIHVVSEIVIPGGTVDFFVVSVSKKKIVDFVGLEIQTLDTTGTVWPERQKFLKSCGISIKPSSENSDSRFGMNWKMTAKTILIQLHHKIQTFEHIKKHLVLAVQDPLLNYMQRKFSFSHVSKANVNDSMHFHSYSLNFEKNYYKISLAKTLSTDADGLGKCLGLNNEARIEMSVIQSSIEAKISGKTLFRI
jgi:hypothetical protein